MCGICGYFDKERKIPLDLLIKMNSTIIHRGPDYGEEWIDGHIGLGHRRLSILDLTKTGNQPMQSSNGRFVIVYNGEIYNQAELKSELVTKGYRFRGTSDTEVILCGIECWGVDILKRLNGIFALAIYDKDKKRLLVARDRFGVKPLYYSFSNGRFIFGSEIKAILGSGNVRPVINYAALHEFLYFGNALGENTLFAGIYKVIPGHYLEICDGQMAKSVYWRHEDILPINGSISENDAIEATRSLLENAVRRQLMSDVPIGVFLSGGVDSSSIAAFASRHYQGKIRSYSAGFDFDGGHNELPMARRIAKLYDCEHNEFMIRGADLPDVIKKLVSHHDEPFSDAANIPLFLLAQQVRASCKVVLQGDGGDELFGGYRRYHLMQRYKLYKAIVSTAMALRHVLPNGMQRQQIERFNAIFSERDERRMFALLLTVESDVHSPVDIMHPRHRAKLLQSDPFLHYKRVCDRFPMLENRSQKMFWIDSLIILPDQFLEKVDKSTMANGVESRVPFLDNELSQFVMTLPSDLKLKHGANKYILKKAMQGIVPNDVLNAPKKGFGVPYKNWLKGPLKDMFRDVTRSRYVTDLQLLDYETLDRLMGEHITGTRDNGFLLWKALNLSLWLEMYKVEVDAN